MSEKLEFCDHCQSHDDDCTCIKCSCGSVDDVNDGVCADCEKDYQDYADTASNRGRHE